MANALPPQTAADLLDRTISNLRILKEREAKYGPLAAPLDLINSIEDHQRACDLLAQAIQSQSVTPEMRDEVAGLLLRSQIVVLIDRAKKPFSGVNPYRGLEKFATADSAYFYGRTEAVEDLHQLVAGVLAPPAAEPFSRWITVIGASGSGKSSLVQAGLFPRLQPSPGADPFWQICALTPGEHPLEQLAVALAPAAGRSSVQLHADLARSPNALRLILLEIQSRLAPSAPLLLFVDQFEEIFVQCRDAQERAFFIDQLKSIAAALDLRLVLLVTLRADFYAQAINAGLGEELKARQYIVTPMQKHELREAILLPAELVGLELERDLALALVQDTGNEPGRLPLLQYALAELFKHKTEQHILTMAAYEEMGGVQGALVNRADRLYQAFTPAQQFIARQLFIQLTDIEHGAEYVSRRTDRSQLDHLGAPEDVQAVINALSHDQERLIVAGETIQVIHEVLLQRWSALHDWIEADKYNITMHRKLSERTRDWWLNRKDPSFLYVGLQLESAREWAFQYGHRVMHPAEHEFLQASMQSAAQAYARQMQVARTLRRRALAATIFGVLALLMMGAALIAAQIARSNAAQARRRADASLAQSLAIQAPGLPDSEQGLLVGLAAARINPPDAAETFGLIAQGLQEILEREYHSVTLPSTPAERMFTVDPLVFDADGRSLLGTQAGAIWQWDLEQDSAPSAILAAQQGRGLVVADRQHRFFVAVKGERTVQLIDRTTNTARDLFTADVTIKKLALSDSGAWLAAATATNAAGDSMLFAWDLAQPQAAPLRFPVADEITSIAFSPDGRLVAVGVSENSLAGDVVIWPLEAGALPIYSLQTNRYSDLRYNGPVWAVAFSSDSRYLAVGLYRNLLVLDATRPDSDPIVLPELGESLWSLDFDGGSGRIAAGGSDGTLFIWEREAWKARTEPLRLKYHSGMVYSVDFSPDGTALASTDLYGVNRLWTFRARPKQARVLTAHSEAVGALAVSPDGALLVSGNRVASELYAWDLQAEEPLPQKFPIYIPSTTVSFSPDGQWLASAGIDVDNLVFLWRIQAKDADPQTLSGHAKAIGASAFSADSRYLATVDWDGVVLIWDMAALDAPPRRLSLDQAIFNYQELAFTPDGRYLLGASSSQISLWRMDDLGAPPLHVSTQRITMISGLAVTPDSATVIVTGAEGYLELWSLEQGALHFKNWQGVPAGLSSVAAYPGGAYFAVGAGNGSVITWRLDDLIHPAQIMRVHQGAVTALAYTPDGRTLISGAEDHLIRLHRPLQGLIEQGCAEARRNLTRAEWRQYLPANDYAAVCPEFPIDQ